MINIQEIRAAFKNAAGLNVEAYEAIRYTIHELTESATNSFAFPVANDVPVIIQRSDTLEQDIWNHAYELLEKYNGKTRGAQAVIETNNVLELTLDNDTSTLVLYPA